MFGAGLGLYLERVTGKQSTNKIEEMATVMPQHVIDPGSRLTKTIQVFRRKK